MSNKTVRFAIIGCGLMGREFASAAARWCHITDDVARPVIVGVCDVSADARAWFEKNFDSVIYSTDNYHELLEKSDIDAVYCAVPHNLHADFYVDIINAGKHLLGEKPFMDTSMETAITRVRSRLVSTKRQTTALWRLSRRIPRLRCVAPANFRIILPARSLSVG